MEVLKVDNTCSLCLNKGMYVMACTCLNCQAALVVTFSKTHEAHGSDLVCPRCGVEGRVTIGKFVEMRA